MKGEIERGIKKVRWRDVELSGFHFGQQVCPRMSVMARQAASFV
jgi:hypothetical protein